MSITTHTDQDKRLHVVYDDERTTQAERYTIWLVNGSRDVLAQPFESPKAVWQRVLNTLAAMRVAITLKSGHLYFATVFAECNTFNPVAVLAHSGSLPSLVNVFVPLISRQ